MSIILFCSCIDKKEKVILINNLKVNDTINISSMVDTIEITKLDEPNDDHIAFIYQLYSTNENYVVFDMKTKKIQIYSQSGKFIKTLSQNGIKDNEGLNIIDCFTDDKANIYVYDFAQMKISIYDSTLSLKKSIKGEQLLHYNHIAPIPNSNNYVGYASYNMNNEGSIKNKNISILDKQLSPLSSYFSYSRKYNDIITLTYNSPFYIYKDSLRFMQHFDPYIYHIDDHAVTKLYKISYIDKNLPSNILKNFFLPHLNDFKNNKISPNERMIFFKDYTYPRYPCIESSKYIYIVSAQNDGKKENLFGSLISKKNITEKFSAINMMENIKYKITIPYFLWYDKYKDQFISYCNGYHLNTILMENSPLRTKIHINESSLYLIKVKLK